MPMGDKLWTPQATFHSVSEVRKWGTEEGLTLTATKKFFLGYANVMRFEKQGECQVSIRREVMLKCIKCGEATMTTSDFGYTCACCGHRYSMDGEIIDCIV